MTSRSKFLVGGAAALALAAAGGGLAIASGAGDDTGDSEAPISGPALERAGAAALDHVGGGEVTDTETGDEESYYEVEVTRPDGGQIDVQLDRDFQVVGQESDEAGEDDAETGED
jgi:uncharacterized membrane protein YkoI